jgi:glutamine amidotransferase
VIGIVNYGSGNINAIANIYKGLNIECKAVSDESELEAVDRLILPGVGAFDECMQQLRESGLQEKLTQLVLLKKKPVLGICIGMHIMADTSDEGVLSGLGWIQGKVKKFSTKSLEAKPYLPHMGWNNVEDINRHAIFKGVEYDQGFYFVHSYYYSCSDDLNILATSYYGDSFSSAIYKNNIFGMQFHPEKSHSNGIKLLENFAKIEIC